MSLLGRCMAAVVVGLACVAGGADAASGFGEPYALTVLAPEHRQVTDPETGVELLFLTSGASHNRNLYFHERSWLSDGSVIVFTSQREPGGLMGYVTATGELVRITAQDGSGLGGATAVKDRPGVYAMAGTRAVEIALSIVPSPDPGGARSSVMARERLVGEIPGALLSLNESCDGRYLCMGVSEPDAHGGSAVVIVDTADGTTRRICGMPAGTTKGISHLQWSVTNPNWLSFANMPIRLWVVDIRDGKPWAPYIERPGELVTHESWWVDDQLIFCGGIHTKPLEDSHVKALEPRTGRVRIIGEGAWWPGATAPELAKRNWWHCSGSPTGNWIAADNWHGDIMLFEGLTARPRSLTVGHRTYGKGDHPEVGWDRRGEQVVFASHMLGEGVHVCVASIPAAWNQELRQFGSRIESVEGLQQPAP